MKLQGTTYNFLKTSTFFFFPFLLSVHVKPILNVSCFRIQANILSASTLAVEQLFWLVWWCFFFFPLHCIAFAYCCSFPSQRVFNNTQSTASGSLQSTRLGLRGSIPTQGLSWRATRAGQRAAGAQAAAPAWALAMPSRWRGSSWAFQLRTGLLLWPRRTVAGRRPADTYSLIYRHRFVVHSCCLQDPADFTHA